MFLEMAHGFSHRFDPLTVCSYDVDVEDVVDLRNDAERKANGVTVNELRCPWFNDLASKRKPASWEVAERMIAEGSAGMIVPSFATGASPAMSNLVLWKWGPKLPHLVEVYDPGGRLPKDQTSWRTP